MKKLNILSLITFVAVLSSCGEFGDLNVDPNTPVKVSTGSLMTAAQRSVSDVIGSNLGALYAQHVSEITYTDDSRYLSITADFSGWYTGPLQNLETYIKLNTDEETKADAAASGSNANQIAAAKILKAYYFHFMTDRWGPLPFSDALKGSEGILLPKYDSQEAIYTGIFNLIDEALAGFDSGNGPDGDFIFNGDVDAWKAFGNTIKMQAALRISDVNASLAKTKFNEAIAAGVITSDLMYPYLPESANQNPWFARYITRTDFAISSHLLAVLDETGDPRKFRYADPTALSVGSGNPEIVGMPYGVAISEVEPAAVSFPNSDYVKAQDAPLPIFTMAQVEFALAEAISLGWQTGDAEAHYKNAIKASLAQWHASFASDAEFDAFYDQDKVRWNAADWKNQLALQKWIGLYMQGYESWAEWRRLDAPTFVKGQSLQNPSKDIPKRFIIASSEANLNGDNYNAAVSSFLGGTDSDGVRLWWDVK